MNKNKPILSIIMPVYNTEKYLKESIESILNQTFKDFEFIIINDGSKDNSLAIIRDYQKKDTRIQILDQNNQGIDKSLNNGLKISKGIYIARMDSDDISLPNRFEKQIKYLEDNNAFICGTWAKTIDEKGDLKEKDFDYPPKTWIGNKIYLIIGNPIIHPSVIFKKEIYNIEKNKKNEELYKKYGGNTEDYELWSRLIPKYKTVNLQEFLLKYRIHSKQITKIHNYKMKLISIKIRILSLFRILF